MAGAQAQLDAIGANHLLHRHASNAVRRRVGQLLLEALAAVHTGQAQIQAVVMTAAAASLLQGLEAGTQGLAAFHQRLQQQQRSEGGIALGQVHAKAHTP